MKPKRSTQCCAYGCNKRKKTGEGRSESEGSDDEQTLLKKDHKRTFHS